MSQTVLVVAAHPDDEVLGCGGTIARHVMEGDRVSVLIVAEGATSRKGGEEADGASDEVDRLKQAACQVSDILGYDDPTFLCFPDNRLDRGDLLDVIKPIEAVIQEVDPDIIYTHHGGDLNVDHRIVHQAVITATRPMPGTHKRSIYCFETLSSTEWSVPSVDQTGFRPVRYVDISQQLEQKMEALEAYADEMRPFPHPRSMEGVRHLAGFRGCSVGCMAAEAFVVIRELW